MNATGMPPRRLRDLLEGLEADLPAGAGDLRIRGVTCDSRAVEPGSLFIAVPGERFDGHDFVPAAAAAGAAAALVETTPPDPGIPFARVRDARRAAGPVAAAFHGRPSDAMRLVGVTGTNGKTTVAWLLDAFFQRETSGGLYCGTVAHRAHAGGRLLEPAAAGLTTREAPEFQALLAVALAAGCRFGAVECSSHGLRQGRLGGTAFEVAVFTNLTRDHLDFHGEFDSYFRAKRELFTDLLRPGGTAVIGWDDPFGVRLAGELQELRPDVRIVGFGSDPGAAIRLAAIRSDLDGTRVSLDGPMGPGEISSPMLGHFSALNLAAAWGALTALGFDGARAAEVLSEAAPPPGRMERIGARRGSRRGRKPAVLVDYAHTPDALARALAAARCLVGEGRLHVVFGCGGERDRGNRPLMGDAAARLADRVIVTSDNPRGEEPGAIIAEIRVGAENPAFGAEVLTEPDRRRAIAEAVAAAAPRDLVLVAGKGHETHQQLGDNRIPFDDRQVVAGALEVSLS
ncbi:MAG: UDP-N-acetylmuramoyl-L-alanyl-D-glutamate--2,6-diaminopimelate ligase [Acidobacteriota bacterium]|nr:UDP-N-acetylmuramoyl-L-alanyl-D-glutamate--2,6-diaminopimelate ligase [Acidobacteriota bacterium]MDE3260569.1 UDP-N-acetylmuramoyl-L-alanyl-D-glutamate--2,6-diaminopimelate ligase [Acidobacteriota bacterium]